MKDRKEKKIINFILIFYSFFVFFLSSFYNTFAFDIVSNENVSISASVGVVNNNNSGGSGNGGGNFLNLSQTSILFSGFAYPDAIVTLLVDGIQKTSVKASKDSFFSITLFDSYDNNTLYTLFAKDIAGERSVLLNYPIFIKKGYNTFVNNIIFSPTISTDKLEIKEGDYLSISGYAMNNEDLLISFEGEIDVVFQVKSNQYGKYNLTLPMTDFPLGNYFVFTKYKNYNRISKLVRFSITNQNVLNTKAVSSIPGDCNRDSVINLVDFSVLSFWFKRTNPPVCLDANEDKIINLKDFSILAFYWTN